jgi:hypothetical protein
LGVSDMPDLDDSVMDATMMWKRAKLSELVKIYSKNSELYTVKLL